MKQVFLLVICIAFASSAVANHTPSKKFSLNPIPVTTVRVANLLDQGLTFTIHCKSKDDDLGTHVVNPGDDYEWSFRHNLFGTTLFFCGINWRDGSIVYDLYKYRSRDYSRCETDCYWEVTNMGLYGYTQRPKEKDIDVKWSKPLN